MNKTVWLTLGLIIAVVALAIISSSTCFMPEIHINIHGLSSRDRLKAYIDYDCRSNYFGLIEKGSVKLGIENDETTILPKIIKVTPYLLPHQPVVHQNVFLNVDGRIYKLWDYTKMSYQRGDELLNDSRDYKNPQGVTVENKEGVLFIEVQFSELLLIEEGPL